MSTERPAYQQRVVDELEELTARLNKLRAFFAGDAFKLIPGREDRELLEQQMCAMMLYQRIMEQRVARFK